MLIFLIYLVCMSLKNVVIRCMKNTDSSLKFLGEEKPSLLVFGEETLSCLEAFGDSKPLSFSQIDLSTDEDSLHVSVYFSDEQFLYFLFLVAISYFESRGK